MTKLLTRAFERAKALPKSDQDVLAERILQTLDGDAKWEALLADPRSESALGKMADEAIAEHRAGKTRPAGRCR